METFNNKSLIDSVAKKEKVCWINPYKLPFNMVDALCQLVLTDKDIDDAEKLLKRFAPFIAASFPETQNNNGIIESALVDINAMKTQLENAYNCKIPGKVLLKMDSHLDVAGSVKARGGIYEVLKHAEDLAIKHGKISCDENYIKFAAKEMKEFFGGFTVQVGSTGNLGLSIGIISAALGFKVKIHMSADAKKWKKDLLRSKGVEVIEYESDYSQAVSEGRRKSLEDPCSYFVDDEWSADLFTGYAVAARRLHSQLDEKGIEVSAKKPLIVYIPSGVGGAPGGISYGLKRIFKDNVHCFFVEPVLFPSVLLGIATQKFEKANVADYGISGITAADGLACASPSGFVTRIMTNLVSGEFTVGDNLLYDYMRLLYKSENIRVEPSGCAAFEGLMGLVTYDNAKTYCEKNGLGSDILADSTQIVWATGGKMVPDEVFEEYLTTYIGGHN